MAAGEAVDPRVDPLGHLEALRPTEQVLHEWCTSARGMALAPTGCQALASANRVSLHGDALEHLSQGQVLLDCISRV
ncbi:MAG: hypothetical protein M3211_07550 [Actinomycetota bacterium]|nr:hypothetical protein [Actinomycetota bacterium]